MEDDMRTMNRRHVLSTGAALTAGITVGSVSQPGPAESCPKKTLSAKWENEYDFGHKLLFMEEYHQGTMEILGRLSGELDLIGDLSSRAAAVIKSGGTVWNSMNIGHMAGTEISEKRGGNPLVIKDIKEIDDVGKGDMLFTNHCNKTIKSARDRGAYVVCVTVNYVNNEFRPEGFSNPNEDNLLLKDVSNEVLHSHVPYYQGLVHAPEIPEITLCPSTITGSGSLYWMLNAEIANKLADKKAEKVDKSAEYLRILTGRIERTSGHMDMIRETAVTMARRVLDGGTWHVKSLEHPGIASELHYVECGPMIVNLRDWNATPEKNVMLINAISPANPDEIKLALESQVEGAFLIGVGPASRNGEAVHGRLIDVADAGFDNFSPETGGVITIKGRKKAICPTSGIVGNAIQQMICAQWTDEMVRRGAVPYYFKGISRVAGRDYINVMKPFFDERGY